MTFVTVTICAIAIVLGYLIGAIPSAYMVTRLTTGKDIRRLGTGHTGTGNVGARNVFVNVNKIAGVAVAVADIAKGAGAVVVAGLLARLTHIPAEAAAVSTYGAGIAALAGHIWPVYLRFAGGGGLATAFGVLAILLTNELILAVAFALVLLVVTGNLVLSASLSLLSVPANAWLKARPWWQVAYPMLLLAIMLVHFLPNIAAEVKKAKSFRDLVSQLVRRGRSGRANLKR